MIGPDRRHALLYPRIAIPFVLIALIWGSSWLVAENLLIDAPAGWPVAHCFAIATIGMFGLVAVRQGRGRRSLTGRQRRRGFGMTLAGHMVALGIGLFQFFLTFSLLQQAQFHLTSGIVAALFGLLVLPNAALALMFVGQALTPRFLLGALVGVGGLALLLVHQASVAAPAGQVGLGVLFAALAIAAASIGSVLQATDIARGSLILAWAMLWATLASAALAWAGSGPPSFPASGQYWGAMLYLALIGVVLAFTLYFRLIRALGPGRAAYTVALVPVVAMALASLLDGYRWPGVALGGGALVLIGLIVALRGREAPIRSGRL